MFYCREQFFPQVQTPEQLEALFMTFIGVRLPQKYFSHWNRVSLTTSEIHCYSIELQYRNPFSLSLLSMNTTEGTELYPRIGRDFDIKVWTNCRMGMMSWAILPLCYIAKQQDLNGEVSNSMLVSVLLMEIYVFKFFWYGHCLYQVFSLVLLNG